MSTINRFAPRVLALPLRTAKLSPMRPLIPLRSAFKGCVAADL